MVTATTADNRTAWAYRAGDLLVLCLRQLARVFKTAPSPARPCSTRTFRASHAHSNTVSLRCSDLLPATLARRSRLSHFLLTQPRLPVLPIPRETRPQRSRLVRPPCVHPRYLSTRLLVDLPAPHTVHRSMNFDSSRARMHGYGEESGRMGVPRPSSPLLQDTVSFGGVSESACRQDPGMLVCVPLHWQVRFLHPMFLQTVGILEPVLAARCLRRYAVVFVAGLLLLQSICVGLRGFVPTRHQQAGNLLDGRHRGRRYEYNSVSRTQTPTNGGVLW
ncbi:hypothetical protein C8T65DRAFT_306403 [Cerioporus squamosus]|nr:hypothetical protein C8T65DRAFT_306403 [Cerioporus squamosus]